MDHHDTEKREDEGVGTKEVSITPVGGSTGAIIPGPIVAPWTGEKIVTNTHVYGGAKTKTQPV
jgi:hypothetical protein